MEEREGFFRTLFKGLTETAGRVGPTLVVVPNEIERPAEKAHAEEEAVDEPAEKTAAPKAH